MTRTDYRRALKGRRCYLGLDLSSTQDLTALAGVFPDEQHFDVLMAFFAPKDRIKDRSTRDRVPYDHWTRTGYQFGDTFKPDLIATPGPVVNYDCLRQEVKDWAAEFNVRQIAYDPWNATDLVTRLEQQDGFTCIPMRQGFASLSAPTKSLEKAIMEKRLRHDGHPVLRWNISNIVVESDAAGNLKISKKVSTERIDGAAALVMAVDLMDRNEGIRPPDYNLFFLNAR